jgi:hypothetical protein
LAEEQVEAAGKSMTGRSSANLHIDVPKSNEKAVPVIW